MGPLSRLTDHFPTPTGVISHAALFPRYASQAATSALDFTTESAYSNYQKAKEGISTVKDALGLVRAAYRTIRGRGKIVEEPTVKPLSFPDHWARQQVIAGGHETTICEMSVDNAIGTYVFAMGHGTESAYYQPWIDRVNARGYNVVTIELPEPEDNDYFANGDRIDEGYEAIIADTVLNPDSAVYKNIPASHIISLLTHSASGKGFESALRKDDRNVDFAKAIFGDRIFHSGIMLDTAHSSSRHAPVFSRLYDFYSQRKHVRDKKGGSTEADRYWIKEELDVAQDTYTSNTQVNVTHAQAYALKHGGIDLVKSVQPSSLLKQAFNRLRWFLNPVQEPPKLTEAFKNLKRTIIMGLDETSACPKTAKDYADFIPGAKFIGIEDVKHNPLMECAKAYEIVARRTMPVAKARFAALKTYAATATYG